LEIEFNVSQRQIMEKWSSYVRANNNSLASIFIEPKLFFLGQVASHHPSGGRVELWELRELPHSTNKMFQMGLPDITQAKKIIIPVS
jgi:hypothetical protein